MALAKRKLFPISRKVRDKAGRKKPPTEGADDGRRGAEPQRRGRALCWAGLVQNPPLTTPRQGGTAHLELQKLASCGARLVPKCPRRAQALTCRPETPGYLGSESDL